MKRTLRLALAATTVLVAGCRDALDVPNTNQPDVARVLANAASIEATIAAGYQTAHNAVLYSSSNLMPQVYVLAEEGYSQLNNFDMGPQGGIPRSPIQNLRGGTNHFSDFSSSQRAARLSVNAVNALDDLMKGGGTTGTAVPVVGNPGNAATDSAQDMRDRAFAFFVIGVDQAQLAMRYDSAGIVHPGMASDVVPPLSGYQQVMADAIRMLDTAEAIASKTWGTTSATLSVDQAWLGGNGNTMTLGPSGTFPQLIRAFRARFRAGVARTPAERAAVDWAKVIADAENGITKDFAVNVGGSTGYSIGYSSQQNVAAAWLQLSPMYYGMADTSHAGDALGSYRDWIAAPPANRQYILIRTPDKRFPSGDTRKAQQASSTKPTSWTSHPFIANRGGGGVDNNADDPGDPWGVSFYDGYRMKYIPLASNTGIYPDILVAELKLLAAEGHLRRGELAQAAAEIDFSRVASGGLPPLVGSAAAGDSTQAVPGTSACVPLVPYGGASGLKCGRIWEALKWEKRIELMFTGANQWFFDSRGWGDLINGTPTQYPVPYQEMDARYGASVNKFYNLGGDVNGGASSATKNTYGNFGF